MANVNEWFKIIRDGQIIGVATDQNFARYSEKSGRILICKAIEGEYIVLNDQFYHDDWMLPVKHGSYVEPIPAKVISIPEKEYDILFRNTVLEMGPVVEVAESEPEDIHSKKVSDEEAVTIDSVRSWKLQQLSAECEKAIEDGFSLVLGDGASHHFSMTENDQINLINLELALERGEDTIYHADGELAQYYSPEDAGLIISGAKQWSQYNRALYNSLKNWVNNIDSLEEIDAVKYDSDIPEEYCTEVLKTLTENF